MIFYKVARLYQKNRAAFRYLTIMIFSSHSDDTRTSLLRKDKSKITYRSDLTYITGYLRETEL